MMPPPIGRKNIAREAQRVKRAANASMMPPPIGRKNVAQNAIDVY